MDARVHRMLDCRGPVGAREDSCESPVLDCRNPVLDRSSPVGARVSSSASEEAVDDAIDIDGDGRNPRSGRSLYVGE